MYYQGNIESNTKGINGPAIITASSTTDYTAYKAVRFDGTQFIADPVTVESKSRLRITGVDSTVPRLMGRIVRRVASRRAEESRPQAEAISANLAINDLKQNIDAEFDKRLKEMNTKIAGANRLIQGYIASGGKLGVRSSQEGIEVHFVPDDREVRFVNTQRAFQHKDTVELWLQIGQQGKESLSLASLVTQFLPGCHRCSVKISSC